jgi:hypothetical protein
MQRQANPTPATEVHRYENGYDEFCKEPAILLPTPSRGGLAVRDLEHVGAPSSAGVILEHLPRPSHGNSQPIC